VITAGIYSKKISKSGSVWFGTGLLGLVEHWSLFLVFVFFVEFQCVGKTEDLTAGVAGEDAVGSLGFQGNHGHIPGTRPIRSNTVAVGRAQLSAAGRSMIDLLFSTIPDISRSSKWNQQF
jgi:hypothetical protein